MRATGFMPTSFRPYVPSGKLSTAVLKPMADAPTDKVSMKQPQPMWICRAGGSVAGSRVPCPRKEPSAGRRRCATSTAGCCVGSERLIWVPHAGPRAGRMDADRRVCVRWTRGPSARCITLRNDLAVSWRTLLKVRTPGGRAGRGRCGGRQLVHTAQAASKAPIMSSDEASLFIEFSEAFHSIHQLE
jgi:hypothetical protein